jgi:hypothetical protein
LKIPDVQAFTGFLRLGNNSTGHSNAKVGRAYGAYLIPDLGAAIQQMAFG